MIKVAVVGLGDISNIHLPVIEANPNVELVAVCDSEESMRDNWIDTGTVFYADYHEMLAKESLDCVHVCLPHHLHYLATKACVEKGVHVFQEKPLDKDLENSIKLVQLEESNKDVKICMSFQNRFNETFVKLQELVESGKYGNVTGLKGLVTWYRPKSYYAEKPWRGKMEKAGGGVMINQSIHTLDLMQLIGGRIEKIRGSIDKLLDYDIEVEDTATANIQFANGARGLFFATITNASNSSVELQILLEKGKFTIKDSVLTAINHLGQKEQIIEDSKLSGSKFYYGASHSKLINHFYRCIENDTDDYIHVRDGLPAMQMIDAICNSSKIKQEIMMEV
ncbi:gfo/Idh/MocA family oxidoreductase [Aquibacillus halophilus]|uniref:Gfo/Idh/MocA family oxidoreductase n=1 Tax=Aquibacillus halophilus TaxID=930132 RepID=A0A6A8DIQ5_9BACI|nr:Gfo/Idh/MocA family oxidoreductase [Aquibacillus halophilus]MRH45130.1 gfo/Idh/MocA family oxidoreductase [Aquibacillus halophilus]